ncbi:hypothetical protein FGG08_005276 [Glutinoglossum americanum]|uniref:Uncharacterized protein n=1 Tax=Glutinoglossum americanum TaxID=1670608 RepID=A0A9P8I0M1_9PEZI|nr:hypothetical protein FGG08_005276 [Glutinoglossum americanum]
MSSSSTTSRGLPLSAPRVFRSNLRQATLIIPRTGERVKRSFTLRGTSRFMRRNADGAVDDRTPLLQRSDTGPPQQGTLGTIIAFGKYELRNAYRFAVSGTGQGIFKCSLAYFLGSMATFVGPVTALLGKQDGKHMVATITVYFNPARSQGSMHEATILATLAFMYAAFISFTSMGVSILFGAWDMVAIGRAVILIVFLGGGLGFVGWLKQRLENPLVNVACSLTSLAIISVLTKEEAVQMGTFSYGKILQVLKMVVMGGIITKVVCLVVGPISARKELREAMIKATDSFSDMLATITRGFLNGSEEELHNPSFNAASNRYKSVFTSLTKNLREAKYEHFVFGTESEYHVEARLVDCMQRLAQNIGGLRSSAETQFGLLSQKTIGGLTTPVSPLASLTTPSTPYPSMFSSGIISPLERQGSLTAIYEVPEENGKGGRSLIKESEPPGHTSDQDNSLSITGSPIEIFEKFIMHLGPSMSLAYTLKQTLDELPFGPGPEYRIAINTQFRTSLVDAIELYSDARGEALNLLYQKNELNKERPLDVVADFEEVAASCGYFSYSLLDFAEEMKVFLDVLDELKRVNEEDCRSWKWLMFWRNIQIRDRKERSRDGECQRLHSSEAGEQAMPHVVSNPRQNYGTPISQSNSGLKQRGIKYFLWGIIRWLRKDDKRFAIKVGVGAAIYALPSFIPKTRPIYSHWRGEWGLLSYMLVCSMTIGSSNTTGLARWPISARQKLQDGLSVLWLRMALIWKRDPLSTLTEGESLNAYMNISEELELQRYLTRLESLRASAVSEFDFKEPFPEETYSRILKSTSNMLDAFHAMNVIISKDLRTSEREVEILKFTANERAQLCARISHLFQVLASSMKLEYPMNSALPSTEHARDRLLAKMFRYRSSGKRAHSTTDGDFALLYAYALVTGQLSAEIAKLGTEVERLFGVLDEDRLKLE